MDEQLRRRKDAFARAVEASFHVKKLARSANQGLHNLRGASNTQQSFQS